MAYKRVPAQNRKKVYNKTATSTRPGKYVKQVDNIPTNGLNKTQRNKLIKNQQTLERRQQRFDNAQNRRTARIDRIKARALSRNINAIGSASAQTAASVGGTIIGNKAISQNSALVSGNSYQDVTSTNDVEKDNYNATENSDQRWR